MGNQEINEHYTEFYAKRSAYVNVYPTEFVVRTFLAYYPGLHMQKFKEGDTVIDIGCGDGRNTLFLMEQGYNVYGTEISEEIVKIAKKRMTELALRRGLREPQLFVGRNSKLPFDDGIADGLLASHVCYYCDEGENIKDNLREYARVLKKDAYLIASVLDNKSFILKDGIKQADGTTIVTSDPYNNRNGYRLRGFDNTDEIIEVFDEFYYDFSFGKGHNNWYGIDENSWWCVCRKK